MASGRATYCTQANALLRKNLTFQKRNMCANIRLICIPILICLFLAALQLLLLLLLDTPPQCPCTCVDTNADGKCDKDPACQLIASIYCAIPNPPEWPPLLKLPSNQFRAVRTHSFTDLPNESCRTTNSCPVTSLFTGNNQSLGKSLANNMLQTSFHVNSSHVYATLANNVLGTDEGFASDDYSDPAFDNNTSVYNLQPNCTPDSKSPASFDLGKFSIDVTCLPSLNVWRNSSSEINDMLFKGYQSGNSEGNINEFVAAYDLLDSSYNKFNVSIWYNSKPDDSMTQSLERVPRLVNLVSNAYLQILNGSNTKILFEFVKGMPKTLSFVRIDAVSKFGLIFYVWIILQLFPVFLQTLVYEKQQKLRIMMKMHGLGDGPYWTITYAYFLTISVVYMVAFVAFGSLVGLNIFRMNDYSIQLAFYFIYINLQIASAFLVATMFSNVKTATVVGHLTVFLSGLLGSNVFEGFLEDQTNSRIWIFLMECYPGFSLYRGVYEFSMSTVEGLGNGTSGMQWGDLKENGMKQTLIIMLVEWFVVMFVAFSIDKAVLFGNCWNPRFFFSQKCVPSRKPSLQRRSSNIVVGLEKEDVVEEREKVEEIILAPSTISSYAIVSNSLEKVYPGRDGNPKKVAVQGLSLALPRGECFGMLGPNGAGKTTFISMMIGLTKPTGGTAYVEGLNIQTDMNEIYTNMGVCPQHDLLWDMLTGREHLLFYGRLKNLKGSALKKAVEESLKNLNLFYGGVADKQARKYSGGMKRRLSVAISLIGDPKVVYMDEPSTGLDPSSRNSLWNVVKQAKRGRAIILTTHSMEEAEALCDRVGIFVDGNFECIGNSNELKARYGGTYVLTMTTSANNEEDIEKMVKTLSPNSKKIYQLAGTQKFELPKDEVRIAEVFQAVEAAKRMFTVFAWGLADTTLEDVFIKVAQGAQAFDTLS
ncbi:hypothetical protein ACFE04_025039 [Oxalis oulophora]